MGPAAASMTAGSSFPRPVAPDREIRYDNRAPRDDGPVIRQPPVAPARESRSPVKQMDVAMVNCPICNDVSHDMLQID